MMMWKIFSLSLSPLLVILSRPFLDDGKETMTNFSSFSFFLMKHRRVV